MLSSDLVRSVLDSAPDAMLIVDASGRIVFANYQVKALFGYDAETLDAERIEVLLPERFRERHVGHRHQFAENRRIRPMGAGLDLFARRRDGTEFPVEISLSPIVDEGQTLVVVAIRDVTDRRTIQTELKEAREAAEYANQAKSRFLATASHDLRQPLQTLSLLNGAMRRLAKEPDLLEALAQGELAIGAMSRLLNALLDISKLESGAIKPEITDFKVAEIFAELRNEFASLAADKGLELHVETCLDCAHSDPSLVEQILRNLISNAIKYTRQGYVRLRCLHEPACVRLEVLDTGIGIPADALAHIYDEFYQVGVSTNTSRDGYGLGLSIVRRIVSLLGLRIDVRSQLGKGSIFSLELPASVKGRIDERRQEPARVAEDRAARMARVLLVEDDPGVRAATRMLLRAEGYEVATAASGAEALKCASERPEIELLITDYHLGSEETGIQVIASVRELLSPNLRAVLITGDTSSAVRDLERDEYLRIASKPINADQFLMLLREFVPPASG